MGPDVGLLAAGAGAWDEGALVGGRLNRSHAARLHISSLDSQEGPHRKLPTSNPRLDLHTAVSE